MVEQQKNSNVIHISNKLRPKQEKPPFHFYVYLSKVILKENKNDDYIELHGLGQATALCVKVAEVLVRHGYTYINKIENKTVSLPENGAQGSRDEKTRKKIKLIIQLKKTKEFDEKTKDLTTRPNPTPTDKGN